MNHNSEQHGTDEDEAWEESRSQQIFRRFRLPTPVSTEKIIAELKDGPLAHAPSGKFTANAAWLVLAALAFNLLRAAGCAASARHAKARWATLRAHLITIPARIASSARRLVLHLPTDWPEP